MKKPLIAFLVVFLLAVGLVAWFKIDEMQTYNTIAKSPAFVVATPEGITKKTKKGREEFQINFIYTVAGNNYPIDSTFMDTEAEAMEFAAKPVEVAYATTAPATAVFKTAYDKRDTSQGMGSLILEALGFGFLLSLLGTAVLLYQFPSLRRT